MWGCGFEPACQKTDLRTSPGDFVESAKILRKTLEARRYALTTYRNEPLWLIETPGHTSNHLCFGLREENACLSGDHIMGWSTTIVAPPDGNMADYMRSLDKIEERNFDILWPTHGSPVREDVNGFIGAYRQHRLDREAAVIKHLKAGETNIPKMVETMYADVDKRLHPAAAMSVLGHMIELIKTNRVVTPDEMPTVRSHFELARTTA